MANTATVGLLRVLLTANAAEFEAGMKSAASAATKWSRDLTAVGRQATAVGAALTKTLTLPLLGLGAGAVKSAMDFESSFAGIKKTVADATDSMGNLTDVGREIQQGMRDLAKQIPINVNELNRIGEAAGQLGIESQNILSFTRVMADLGVTTNLSSDQAASSLARLANITQMPQTNFDRLGSTVVALGNDLATTESEIVEFGLRIAGAGHLAGLTEAQILAIGGAMSSVGVEAEAGGTAVQKVLLSITEAAATGNKDLAVFAQTAGMSAQDFAKAWETDAAGAFTEFVEGLGRSGTDAFKILERLGLEDQRLIRSFLSLANAGDLLRTSVDLGTQAWSENSALAKEAEQRYKTFESQLKLFWAQVRDVGVEIGTALLPTLRDLLTVVQPVIGGIAKAADWFGKLPQPIRLVAVGIAGLLAAIGPMLFVFGQMTTALGLVAGAFGTKGLAIKTLTPLMAAMGATTIPALIGSLGLLAIAVASVTAVVYAGIQAWKLWGEHQERAKGVELEQARRYAMMEQASKIAGRGILTYGEAVQIVTQEARRLADEQERLTTVYDQAAGPPERLAPKIRKVAQASDEATAAFLAQKAALKALQDQYSGVTTFAEAAMHMKAIGDVTKLTHDEQQRALGVLGAALDKYNALGQIAPPALLATVIQLDAMNAKLNDSVSHVELLGLTFDDALDPPSIAATVRELERLGKIVPGFEKGQTTFTPVIPGTVFDTTGVQAGKSLGASMLGGLQETFKSSFGPTIMQAITGGGSVGKAIGSLLGGSLTSSLSDFLSRSAPQFMKGFFGKFVDSFLPGVGALLGPLLGKIGGFFKGLFGVSEEVKKARGELESFQETLRATLPESQRKGLQGWEQDIVAIKKALIATGRSAADAEKLAAALWDTDNPDRMRAAIEEINDALKAQEEQLARNREEASDIYDGLIEAAAETGERLPATFLPAIEQLREMGILTDEQAAKLKALTGEGEFDLKKLQEDAQALGIDFNALGPKFQSAGLTAKFEELHGRMSRLINAGGDVGTVISGSREEISALILEAKRMGTSVPAQFKPWVEELMRTGQLVDENGQALEDLSGINFGDPIVTAMERMIDKLEEFLDKILGGLIPALDRTAGDYQINFKGTYTGPGPITLPVEGPLLDGMSGVDVSRVGGLSSSLSLASSASLPTSGSFTRDSTDTSAAASFEQTLQRFEMTMPVLLRDAVRGVI